MRLLRAALLGTAVLLATAGTPRAAPPRSVLLASGGGPAVEPRGELLLDGTGALIGTAARGGPDDAGTVFKLTPPAGGEAHWTQSILYAFKGGTRDGAQPLAGLIADASGALYGTTFLGGPANLGTVFRLTPPAPGRRFWTRTILTAFTHPKSDGAYPSGKLLLDASGALYGTTTEGGPGCDHDSGCGTVFKLTPPAPGTRRWTRTTLHSFDDTTGTPRGALVADADGALYGTTSSSASSVVYRLRPLPDGSWAYSVLLSDRNVAASIWAGLLMGADGALYGTSQLGGTARAGTVFRLAPPASGDAWTATILHTFYPPAGDGAGPIAPLITDASGALYGTTELGGQFGQGTVFRLAPAAGGGWTETILHHFMRGPADGSEPYAGLTMDADGNLAGVTDRGGATDAGAVFAIPGGAAPG